MSDHQVPVLVVGGSLVGLSASLLLAARGVPHMLVERHRGTAVHPRAASFHQGTMEIFRSYVLRVDSTLPKDDLMDPLDDAAIELGALYRSAGVVDPPAADAALEDPGSPTGRPGTRAPHLPLERDGTPISTHDLFGDGFVLLAGSAGQACATRCRRTCHWRATALPPAARSWIGQTGSRRRTESSPAEPSSCDPTASSAGGQRPRPMIHSARSRTR
jgi:hypothetical protein